jgi:hypothetical protein
MFMHVGAHGEEAALAAAVGRCSPDVGERPEEGRDPRADVIRPGPRWTRNGSMPPA